MRRRTAITAAALLALTASGCNLEDRIIREDVVLPPPPPDEALQIVGLPVPDAELTGEEGLHPSELSEEWSLRITFTMEPWEVDAWIVEAFGGPEWLLEREKGDPVDQRIPPEDVLDGSRSKKGTNPEDRSATYAVLVHPDGRDVIIAAAWTAR